MGYPVQKVDAKPLRDLIKYHGLSVPEIAARTGLSTSAIYTWEREGEMPKYMLMVCKGILADITRAPNEPVSERETFLVRVPPEKRELLLNTLRLSDIPYRSLDELN